MSRSILHDPVVSRRVRRLMPMLTLVGVSACTSVLGIEDLHEGPRPGTGGAPHSDGGAGTTAGRSSLGGEANNGGTGGTAQPSAGAGNDNQAGDASIGGVDGIGGMGNDAGAGGAAPGTGTVTGKVIDGYGRPFANIPVQIGATVVSTDDEGVFSVPKVARPYDISLVVPDASWVFQDLTRPDPTLQVYRGLDFDHTTKVTIDRSGGTLDANDRFSLAVGLPTWNEEWPGESIDTTSPYNVYWNVDLTAVGLFHGLEWTLNGTTGLPASYKAYDTQGQAEADGIPGRIALNLSPKTITSKAVTGTATASGSGIHTSVFVRFGGGASIQVVDDKPTGAFSYLTPILPNASITVAAWQGNPDQGPLGLVHKDGLYPGDTTEPLHIPAPPTLGRPAPYALNVDENTPFSITPGADNAGTFLIALSSSETENKLYIATTRKVLDKLPSVVQGGWLLEHAIGTDVPAEYRWWVETHGSFATVDQMTGPTGYLDEFGVRYIAPVGFHEQDGTYSYSETHKFTTKNR